MTDADKQDKNEMEEWKAEKKRGLVITMRDLSFVPKKMFVSIYAVPLT